MAVPVQHDTTLPWWPRPAIGVRGPPSYFAFGVVGYAAALVLVTGLVARAHVGLRMWLVLALVPPATLVAAFHLASSGLLSRRVVFYEKALVALGCTALALAVTRQPLAIGLDLAALGLGTFLAVARIGCLRAGCCHGRPMALGVRYGWDHVATGFPERWVGRAIFPIQLVDGATSALGVAIGTALQLSPHASGEPLAAWTCAYGAARFGVELERGDPVRRYRCGLSDPQWVAFATVVCAAAYRPSAWTIGTAGALAVAAAALVFARTTGHWSYLWLTSARHLAEVDRILEQLVVNGPAITSSEGLRLSFDPRPDGALDLRLEHPGRRPLGARTARAIARQLGRRWTVLGVRARRSGHRVALVAEVAPEALVNRA